MYSCDILRHCIQRAFFLGQQDPTTIQDAKSASTSQFASIACIPTPLFSHYIQGDQNAQRKQATSQIEPIGCLDLLSPSGPFHPPWLESVFHFEETQSKLGFSPDQGLNETQSSFSENRKYSNVSISNTQGRLRGYSLSPRNRKNSDRNSGSCQEPESTNSMQQKEDDQSKECMDEKSADNSKKKKKSRSLSFHSAAPEVSEKDCDMSKNSGDPRDIAPIKMATLESPLLLVMLRCDKPKKCHPALLRAIQPYLQIASRAMSQAMSVRHTVLERNAAAAQSHIASWQAEKAEFLLEMVKLVAHRGTGAIGDLMETIIDIAYETLESDRVTLFLRDEQKNELWCRVSKDAKGIRVPITPKSIVGYVAMTKEFVNIVDAYSDPRFNRDVDIKTGYKTQTILCAPVCDSMNNVVGVLQAINKIQGVFTGRDQELLEAICHEVGALIGLKTSDASYALTLAQISENEDDSQSNANSAILTSMLANYTGAHHREQSTSGVKQSSSKTNSSDESNHTKLLLPEDHVITEEKTLEQFANTKQDNQSHTDRKTKDLGDAKGDQVETKIEVPVNAMLNTTAKEATHHFAYENISQSAITLRSTKSINEVEIIQLKSDIKSWNFDVWRWSEEVLVSSISSVMNDLNLLQKFEIQSSKLTEFVHSIKEHYHNNPYHNFYHAFSVFQVSYLLTLETRARLIMNEIDILGLLIAAICHDVDHPGRTNAFLINSVHPLALQYNDVSVLENHHSALTFRLLQDRNQNFVSSMDSSDFSNLRLTIVKILILGFVCFYIVIYT